MRCDECNIREAQYTIAIVAGAESSTRHLCESCMQKLRAKGEQKGFAELIHQAVHAIVFQGLAGEAPAEPEYPAIQCPLCSTTLPSVMKTGQVGCANCYRVFREPLLSLVEKSRQHLNATYNPDWRDQAPPPPQSEQLRQTELTKRLQEAIQAEDYELAARIRDELAGKEAEEP